MSTLKERLEELMNDYNLVTQQQLADFADVSKGLVGQWFNGSTGLGKKPLLAFQKKTNYSTQWLIDGTGEKYQPNKDIEDLPMMYRSDTDETRDGWIAIPRLSAVGELGSGALMDDPDEIVDFVMVLEAWARQQFGGNLKKLRIINTKGDSMQGTINHGDVVFVDSSVERFDGDGIYVLAMPAGLRIKRLQGLSTGGLRIISDNKAYETETVSGAELDNIRICGRVKGSWTLTIF